MHNQNHINKQLEDDASARIGWVFFLNVIFTVIEFIGGWLTNSTAIMADAVHDLGDSISIGAAWCLNKLGNKGANNTFSYGYKRFSLLGALINGIVLIVGSILILFEAIPRLSNPQMPQVEGMLFLAILGIVVNGYAAYKLSKGQTLNERVLNWHLLEDALGWVAVLMVTLVLLVKPWPILDPILSIGFTLFILINVFRNLKQTLMLFLQATPDEKQRNELEKVLLNHTHIGEVHHLHIWSLDGENDVLTVHLVLKKELSVDEIKSLKQTIQQSLVNYAFAHTTVEIEFVDEHCRDNDE